MHLSLWHRIKLALTLHLDKMYLLKLPWQTFSNLIIVCCYDNEPTILNIDTACNKLKCEMANSIFHNYLPIIIH
jgi:hypothetical protein